MRSILLSRVNESITGIGIILPARESVEIANRRRSPLRYGGVTRCVTASNSRREFIPLIYISAFRFTRVFTSGAKDYIGRECARGANNIFNPLAFTGELYELRRCTLNAVILIGTRARYFPARIYATFPSRIYKLSAMNTRKQPEVS